MSSGPSRQANFSTVSPPPRLAAHSARFRVAHGARHAERPGGYLLRDVVDSPLGGSANPTGAVDLTSDRGDGNSGIGLRKFRQAVGGRWRSGPGLGGAVGVSRK